MKKEFNELYSHEHKDGYDSDGEQQLQREEAEDLADEASANQNLLEIAYVLIGILLWQHVPSALLLYPRFV